MTTGSRTRLALVLLVALAPVAGAQELPAFPSGEIPTWEPDPAAPDPAEPLAIDQDGLVFQGSMASPRIVSVTAPDGQPVFSYAVDDAGAARLDVGGENVVADATLLAVQGNPLGDAFALYVRDLDGNVHEVVVDRAALAANVALPLDQQAPAVEVVRPPDWPGAPSAPFLVYVEDDAGDHVAAARLDGKPWLRNGGAHELGLQIPLAEADFSRVFVRAMQAEGEGATEADFARVRETADAAVFEGRIRPANLGAKDGDEVQLQVFYERRPSPLVIERFPEAVVYGYRVDGGAPTLTFNVPAEADDISFAATWTGADALSGFGGVTVDVREKGTAEWTSWLTRSAAKSATFTGEWGTTYEFRAVALDAVGNPSAAVTRQTVVSPASGAPGAPAGNAAPTAEITSPRTGALVAGVATVAWTASDADGTPLSSKLELSKDGGRTWRLLFSGAGSSASWDTTGDADGPGYRLRLTVSDGTKTASDDVSSLTVRNVAAAPPAPGPSGTPPPSSTPAAPAPTTAPSQPDDGDALAPASDAGDKGVPAPFAGLAIAAAALLALRKRRA